MLLDEFCWARRVSGQRVTGVMLISCPEWLTQLLGVAKISWRFGCFGALMSGLQDFDLAVSLIIAGAALGIRLPTVG